MYIVTSVKALHFTLNMALVVGALNTCLKTVIHATYK